MLINCTTKGCLQKTEAKLDRKTGDVICAECGNSVINVSPYIKKALESSGQVLRTRKPTQAFQALCKACNANRQLYINGERAFCKICDTQVHVTPSFLRGLKEYLESKKKEEKE